MKKLKSKIKIKIFALCMASLTLMFASCKNENKISDIGNACPHKNMHSEDSQKNLVVKDILVGMKSRKQIVSYIVASAILEKPKSLASEDGWRIV